MKELFIIRHGQTEYNRLSMIQGSGIDADLNSTGYRQADAFFQHFKDVPFRRIYTSSLIRTQQSVAQFLDAGIPWVKDSGLNEISWGNSEGQAIDSIADDTYHKVVRQWVMGNTHYKMPGGQSPDELLALQKPIIERILADTANPILICMHGRAMRILLCYLTGQDLKLMDMFEHRNLCLYKLVGNTIPLKIELANYLDYYPVNTN